MDPGEGNNDRNSEEQLMQGQCTSDFDGERQIAFHTRQDYRKKYREGVEQWGDEPTTEYKRHVHAGSRFVQRSNDKK